MVCVASVWLEVPCFLKDFSSVVIGSSVITSDVVDDDQSYGLFSEHFISRADKIPGAVYSTYVDSCQKQRQQKCRFSLSFLNSVSYFSSVILLYT